MPRPTIYTLEIAKAICDALADGMTLRAISEREGMPCRSSIAAWKRRYPEFRDALYEARNDHADVLADEIVSIADTEADPQKARNMIEARKWRCGVIRPREYGQKLDLAVHQMVDHRELHKQAIERARRMYPGLHPIEGKELQTPGGEPAGIAQAGPSAVDIFA
jgi:hypothetical protein